MIFLILTISFNLLSTGSLQELNDANNNFQLPQQNFGGPMPILADQWPVQTIQTVQGNFFGQAFRNINSKPCSSRRSLQDSEEQWIPTFSTKIIKPVTNFGPAQAITEENNAPLVTPIVEENNAPLVTPIVEENVPTIDDSDINSRKSLLFDGIPEKTIPEIDEPIETLGELITDDRSGIDMTPFNDVNFSVANNADEEVEKSSPDDILTEDMKMELENETEIESQEETVTLLEECMNKQNKIKKDNITENSRRSMLKIEEQESNLAEIYNNAENELNNKNNLNMLPNDDNNNLIIAKEKDKDKNTVNMRKATRAKLMEKGKRPVQDSNNEILEPTKGSGVSELSESRMMLMDYSRLCYACSTASNPTCWAPDRKTTVKYCRRGHEACVTKTFQTGNKLTLVRDCGSSCEDVDIPGFVPKYKSCAICHSDLCNSAYTINSHNIIFAFVLITVIKCIY